jgi:hypothetical protein
MAVSTIATVAFQVAGINEKINKAAASVFGEDLVKIGNIFGAVYGAFGGGFGSTSTAAGYGEALGAAEPVASIGEMGSLADMAGGVEAMSGMDALAMEGYDGGFNSAEQLAGDADAIKSMGGEAEAVAKVPEAQNVVERVKETPMDVANATQKPQSLLPETAKAPATNAMGANAAAPQATAAQVQATAPNAAAPVQGQRSFFDRLVFDGKGNVSTEAMRMGGQVLSGLGKGYTAAEIAKERERQFDAEMRMRNQRTGLRVTQ